MPHQQQGLDDLIYKHDSKQHKTPSPSSTSWTRDKKLLYSVNDTILSSRRSGDSHRREDTNNRQFVTLVDQSNANSSSNNTNSNASTSNSTIIGQYELKRTLGKGNFATVKLAQHRIIHHLVAIKIIKTSVLSEDNLMKINREIEVLKKLGKHDHIVRLYQVIKTKRYFMLVTEYCANGELYEYLVDRGKLSESRASNYFLQILSAIEYLHYHNVVHRDLKAENLLLTNDYKTVKIADFGFANYYKGDKLLSTWCGSPPYAAPELFKGIQYVGPPVDIWSMGIILYTLVCGSLPFDGHNLEFLKSRVLSGKFRIPFFMSTDCESLIRGMLRLDPERRFSLRQIKAHCWTVKHNNGSRKEPTNIIDTTNNQPTVFMGPIASNSNSSNMNAESSNAGSVKSLDKNINSTSSNRGQSLDLEDDKKKISVLSNEDSSMLCLITSTDDKSRLNDQKDVCVKPSKIQNFVDTEIVNAVSNMSLDSNTSSVSVSQGNDSMSATPASMRRIDTGSFSIVQSCLSKENSVDDQIIDYMVDNLKVADGSGTIRQSIADDKYDDLHAIYRLLKYEPKVILGSQVSTEFKIPSLPLISKDKQQSCKKPSITTGFFNAPTVNNGKPALPCDNIVPNKANKNVYVECRLDHRNGDEQIGAINLITHHTGHHNESNQKILKQERKKPEDSRWKVPPQLFLTPPSDNQVRQSNQVSMASNQEAELEPELTEDGSPTAPKPSKGVARHSFDSTLQQLGNSSGTPDFSNNMLTLANTAMGHCLWDSSILDTLGVSTPPGYNNPPPSSFNIGENLLTGYLATQSNVNENPQESALQIVQNLAQITTNLSQIGAQTPCPQNQAINQNLLLAQLNSLALSGAVTHSSMLTQGNQATPIQFTPNNLMNQNINVMNNLAMQNTIKNPCIPNISLLDPNGLASGLERRASDGQASYNSLTAANANVIHEGQTSIELNTSKETVPCQASINMATAINLSSSSNQLSSNSNRYPMNQNSPNNSMLMSSNVGPQLDENAASLSTDPENRTIQHLNQAQINPLDLTKGSKDTRHDSHQLFDNNNQFVRTTGQRSHSTTSASVIFHNWPNSATTSPRSSLFMSSNTNNSIQIPFCQVSPSTVSLTGGGPGHLLNRRKRHSLETESRHHHHQNHYLQQQHIHHQHPASHQFVPNFHHMNNYNDSSRSLRQNTQQYLQYPVNSHIGQLRNFAQTFSYKKLTKKQSSPTGWESTSTNNPPPKM